MTHKYLTQIRTIPNYYEDQSNFAKTLRSINYSFKSASNLLIKNKKTRIITSVLAVYIVLTSGFVVAFVNVDNNQANAQNFVPASNLNISIKKQKVEADIMVIRMEVQNQTNQTIVNPSFQFQSSFDNVSWLMSNNDLNNNKVDTQSGFFKLANIGPSQKISYSIYGQLKNPSIDKIAITTKILYTTENKAKELNSPKFLIDLK